MASTWEVSKKYIHIYPTNQPTAPQGNIQDDVLAPLASLFSASQLHSQVEQVSIIVVFITKHILKFDFQIANAF